MKDVDVLHFLIIGNDHRFAHVNGKIKLKNYLNYVQKNAVNVKKKSKIVFNITNPTEIFVQEQKQLLTQVCKM